jgi:hypothetical protein
MSMLWMDGMVPVIQVFFPLLCVQLQISFVPLPIFAYAPSLPIHTFAERYEQVIFLSTEGENDKVE